MSTDTVATVPAEVLADAEAVIEALTSGKKLDPEVARHIQERTERIRERVLQEHGPLDIAVPAIRELRDA